jgi:Lrp/AsnC family transcriptional regulator for asnA, asnC and gidA
MSLDGRTRARSRTERSGEDVSDLDKRIIEHLQTDGRRPFTQIATDPLKLGFHQMAMIGIRCESDQLVTVAEAVAEMPEVDYVVITAGTYDLLIETVCEDNEALLRFLTEKLRAIEGVRETETFVYLRMVKQTYQWGTR